MAIVVGIVALLLCAATVFIIARHRLKVDLQTLSPKDRQRHIDILAADKLLKAAQRAYDSSVAVAAKRLSAAQTPAVLARCGSAILTEMTIVLDGNSRNLTSGIRVDVDASGDIQKYATSRSTVTRVATGALLFGAAGAIVGGVAKKTQVHTNDTRQLFLIVTGPDWQEVVQANPHLGGAARQFAAAVFSHSSHTQELAKQFRARAAEGQRQHQMAVANTGQLEGSRRARVVLELDPLAELRAARAEAKRAHKQFNPTNWAQPR